MADPTPIEAARTAKVAADKAAKTAADAAEAPKAAAKVATKAAKDADAAAVRAQNSAKRNPSPAATQRATDAAATAAAAHTKADEKTAAATAARTKASEASAVKAKADAVLAKLTNEKLEASLPADEWDEIVNQIEQNCNKDAIVDGVVKPCGRIKKRNCAGPTPDKDARMDQAMQDAINTDQGTDIEFKQIADWEGGQATEAYVPWFPIDVDVKDGAISADTGRVSAKNRALTGNSASGVTIGTGVDLGQQDATAYEKRLLDAGVPEALVIKLTPYMGLKRSEACRYLRAHPLVVTKDEADQIDKEMKSYHAKLAKAKYNSVAKKIANEPTFDQLSTEEQTVLMSRQYQDGGLSSKASKDLMTAMASRNSSDAVDVLSTSNYTGPAHTGRISKEHDYLKASYPAPVSRAPTASAPPAAPGAQPANHPPGG